MVKGDNGNGNIYDDSHVDDKIVMMMTKLTPYTKKPIACRLPNISHNSDDWHI